MNVEFYDAKKENELDQFVDIKTSGNVLLEMIFTNLDEGIYLSDRQIVELIRHSLNCDLLSHEFHVCRYGFNSVKVVVLPLGSIDETK